MENQVIKVQTNESIISKLKNAFTSPGCVLSEAMQNARRASATRVEFSYLDEDALLIVDDGSGIKDLADFLTLAGSGWSQEVVQKEGAFGMGSFSMIYYCDRIRVESCGQGFEAYTLDILNHMDIEVFQSDVTTGTRIALYGYHISEENNASRIEHKLTRLAEGFSIPVYYDGVELERPYSLDKCDQAFLQTPIGYCAVTGFEKDLASVKMPFRLEFGTTASLLFFQGLPVGSDKSHHYRHSGNVVHLDESQFEVRMPDRDVLIDHGVQSMRVEAAIRELWQKKLTELKSQLEPAVFANNFASTLKYWGFSELLNDMDVLPDGVLYQVSEMPEIGSDATCNYTTSVTGMTREMLESSGRLILNLDDSHGYDDYQVHQYAFHVDALCVDHSTLKVLHANHWLHKLLITIEEADLTVKVNSPGKSGQYSGYGWFNYQCCESFEISGPVGAATVVEYCFAIDDDNMLIPSRALSGDDVKVITNYYDENDTFDESACDQDIERFRALLYLLNESPEDGILAILRTVGLREFDLHGRKLLVEFDDNGIPEKVSLPDIDEAA